jgi:cytochrome c-type biogenesis protein CcmE
MQARTRNKVAIVIFVVYTVALATAVVFATLRQITRTEIEDARKAAAQAAAEQRRYIGTIVIPADIIGRCRQLEFDNITGAIREGDEIQCSYESFSTDSTSNRIDTIRDAFSKR